MSVARIGAVTIGQAPRVDVTSELRRFLDPAVEILEGGALDGLDIEELQAHPPESGSTTLVSRLSDGSEVAVDSHFVLPRLQRQINNLEHDVEFILLLCTAPFDDIKSNVPLLLPGVVLGSLVTGIAVRRIGVITPSPAQMETQRRKWRKVVPDVVVEAASPYFNPVGLEDAAAGLAREGVDLVVMDCIGYTSVMKTIVRRATNKPVLTASGVLGRVASEMLE